MKRILFTLTATVVGLVALLSFKSRGHPLTTPGALPAASVGAGAPATGSQRTSQSPRGAAPPRPGATATTRTTLGTAVQTQYGVVQVRVKTTGTHIASVSFAQLTAYDGRSQEINSQAAPILLQETLAAQSAHIDVVSGASYTSEGYIQSLQSALDQVGIR